MLQIQDAQIMCPHYRCCAREWTSVSCLQKLKTKYFLYGPVFDSSRVGKKENERRARKRKSNEQYGSRHVSGFNNRIQVTVDDTSLTEGYEVVSIQETSALGCYGCKYRIRKKASDLVPGEPYDIFLRSKECRALRRRGSTSTAVSISKDPEYVYYHPLKSCVPGKNIGQEI